jgi:hypothetical protein
MTYLHIMRDIRREMDEQGKVSSDGDFLREAICRLGEIGHAMAGDVQSWQREELIGLVALCVARLERMGDDTGR